MKALSIAGVLLLTTTPPAIGAESPSAQTAPPPSSGKPASSEAGIEDAVRTVERMRADPHVQKMLGLARGVFIIPRFDRQAMLVRDQDSRGILLVRDGSRWSNPVFYHIGPILLGAHAGAGIKSMAAMLISEEALNRFVRGERFSLSMDDGFNMANHASQAGPFPDQGDDAMMWSDAAGIFPGAAVRLDDVRPDERTNRRYYGEQAMPREIVGASGTGKPELEKLRKAIAR